MLEEEVVVESAVDDGDVGGGGGIALASFFLLLDLVSIFERVDGFRGLFHFGGGLRSGRF